MAKQDTLKALERILGNAPTRTPNVRVLATVKSHHKCDFAQLGLATGANYETLLDGTPYQAPFGQDPQAFMRGRMFEDSVKNDGYDLLLKMLREQAGFPVTAARVVNLREGFPKTAAGLAARARATNTLIRKIALREADAPNIIDGAILSIEIAGKVRYFEADGLAAAADGRIFLAEIKSFPVTDGQFDGEKMGAAEDQAAWYILVCRHTLRLLELPTDVVADTGYIILPKNTGLTPTLLKRDLAARVRNAQRLLESTPDIGEMAQLGAGLQYPDPATTDAEDRVITIEHMMDTVGTAFEPSCLQDCGMSRLCRDRAHLAGLATACGTKIAGELPGVQNLHRAGELANGALPAPEEKDIAADLVTARGILDRIRTLGVL
jgi:hypothetical protein